MRVVPLCFLLGVGVFATFPNSANASPWTLPEGELVLVGGFEYQTATREWFERGSDFGLRRFPLNGRYSASNFNLDVRYGITDAFELSIQVPFRVVTYESDPVILAEPAAGGDRAFFTANILDFTQTEVGLGDFRISARYQVLRAPIVTAFELGIKAPSGYDQPEGTFGGTVTSIQEFESRSDELSTPENIGDDVTLGDGQADINAGVLLGYSFDFGMFLRLDAGYRLRLGGAGDQVYGSFRAGQLFLQRILPYAGVDVQYAVTDGEILGISVAARDPNLPAAQYQQGDLFLRAVPLERSAVDLAVGLIVRVTDTVEMNFGYRRTLWGENTAQIDAFNASIGLRTNLLGGPPPPMPEPQFEEPIEDEPLEAESLEEEPAFEEPAEGETFDAPSEPISPDPISAQSAGASEEGFMPEEEAAEPVDAETEQP
ncbi:MAG: hypothetical protein AAGF12_15480 [Myxococcota bacterium]